jgi:hypothetical protein
MLHDSCNSPALVTLSHNKKISETHHAIRSIAGDLPATPATSSDQACLIHMQTPPHRSLAFRLPRDSLDKIHKLRCSTRLRTTSTMRTKAMSMKEKWRISMHYRRVVSTSGRAT